MSPKCCTKVAQKLSCGALKGASILSGVDLNYVGIVESSDFQTVGITTLLIDPISMKYFESLIYAPTDFRVSDRKDWAYLTTWLCTTHNSEARCNL